MSVGELAATMPIKTVAPVVLFQGAARRFRLRSRRVNSLIDAHGIVESCA
jgi:hypothetical protein